MPKKNAKAQQKSNELDGAEFFAAINLIEKEKGIPKAYMLEKITQALVTAYKRDHEGIGDNVTVEADEEKGAVRMFIKKDVVEEVDNPFTEMSLEAAREKAGAKPSAPAAEPGCPPRFPRRRGQAASGILRPGARSPPGPQGDPGPRSGFGPEPEVPSRPGRPLW